MTAGVEERTRTERRLRRRSTRCLLRALGYLGVWLLVLVASVAIALLVTPMQAASVSGETVRVGATAPSVSLSGPGELDLFGQRLDTSTQFAGPLRPRLSLSRLTLSKQLADLATARDPSASIGHALAAGWTRYFVWETCVAGAAAAILLAAVVGWLHLPRRRGLVLVAVGLVLVEAVNLGAVMVTAYTAPGRLRAVQSLDALVGRSPLPTPHAAAGAPRKGVSIVVMGDSTAAGIGNQPVPNGTALDRACGRSADSYARALASVDQAEVLNLSCSGASVTEGILGAQPLKHVTAPSQLAQAAKVTSASMVIVSIGADDLNWADLLRICAVTANCDDKASVAYFQQQLATFTVNYYEMLTQLARLPSRPAILVNLYYNPFSADSSCLRAAGLTPSKRASLTGLLNALNSVLSKGADAIGATAVRPDFTGHALCDPQSYVQDLHGKAPFHPTAAGELAIALADDHAAQTPNEAH